MFEYNFKLVKLCYCEMLENIRIINKIKNIFKIK